ncbi:MAG: hypothetical protein R6W82_03430 [bacterium]
MRRHPPRTAVLLSLLLLTVGVGTALSQEGPHPWLRAVPEVGGLLSDLQLARLEAPCPARFPADDAAASRARALREDLLEARAFWRNLLGATVDGGILIGDSAVWTAVLPDTWYGMPGARVRTREDGLLAVVAADRPTRFGEEAGELAGIAPTAFRGLLIARGLDGVEGAERYADLVRWVLLAEELSDGLRIGARSWWQRRLVGAAGAWMLLASPRGGEIEPGGAGVMRSWGWFFRSYYRDIASPLSAAGDMPPEGDLRRRLELDARLFALGRELVEHRREETFARLRTAWPVDAPGMDTAEALEALFEQFPDLDHWLGWLEDPRRTIPPSIPPR